MLVWLFGVASNIALGHYACTLQYRSYGSFAQSSYSPILFQLCIDHVGCTVPSSLVMFLLYVDTTWAFAESRIFEAWKLLLLRKHTFVWLYLYS